MEHPFVSRQLGIIAEDRVLATRGASALVLAQGAAGELDPVLLAEVHPHGAWLDWCAPEP
jgi:hypothetical protein